MHALYQTTHTNSTCRIVGIPWDPAGGYRRLHQHPDTGRGATGLAGDEHQRGLATNFVLGVGWTGANSCASTWLPHMHADMLIILPTKMRAAAPTRQCLKLPPSAHALEVARTKGRARGGDMNPGTWTLCSIFADELVINKIVNFFLTWIACCTLPY